jgi:glycosyltransferase involved in cell wall biosynthesis
MPTENVWVINQFAGTPTSGWGERHFYLSEYWLQQHSVHIISGSFNHMFSTLPHAPNRYNFESIDNRKFCWVKVPKYKPESIGRFWSMIVFSWRTFFLPVSKIGKPTVIIVSSMPIFPIITGFLLKKKFNAKRLIFEIRDLWPLTAIQLGGIHENHPFIRLMYLIEKLGYRKSDYIVSLLPNADKYINRISKMPEKFRYIPNGLSEEVLRSEPLNTQVFNLIPKGKFIIGYTGTIGLANALEYFVDAAKLLSSREEIHFFIVGDGYLKEALIRSSSGYKNITFINKIPKNQVQSLLKYFDACFVGRNGSSLFEYGVSANKYFDYMLAGKPILDSNNFIRDPVELSGCGIIVRPDSSEAIADGVLELYNMPKKDLESMGLRGKNYVREFHDIKHLSSIYAELFN